MPQDIRLWKVDSDQDFLQEIARRSLDLEVRLHHWLERDISIIADDLLVIGSEVETDYGGYIDLLCINPNGDLVILELKRHLTPREVVAQALDYASWVEGLSSERITEIAGDYLQKCHPEIDFEEYFLKKFSSELPEVLNSNHSMIVVAAQIDRSSERIINYLSQKYGVSINAITFQYFQQAGNDEILGRVFLIEPELVSQSNKNSKSYKRKPNLSQEEIKATLSEKGLENIFDLVYSEMLGKIFYKTGTTRSSLTFNGGYSEANNAVIFSLAVQESNPNEGLKFICYTSRFSEYLGVEEEEVLYCLPEEHKPWKYYSSAPPFWSGHQGFFKSQEDVQQFLTRLTEVKSHGR